MNRLKEVLRDFLYRGVKSEIEIEQDQRKATIQTRLDGYIGG